MKKPWRFFNDDDRNDKKADEVFGPEVWNAFLPIAGRFDEIFEDMRDE